jgi:hypothetical protein
MIRESLWFFLTVALPGNEGVFDGGRNVCEQVIFLFLSEI